MTNANIENPNFLMWEYSKKEFFKRGFQMSFSKEFSKRVFQKSFSKAFYKRVSQKSFSQKEFFTIVLKNSFSEKSIQNGSKFFSVFFSRKSFLFHKMFENIK